jgi:hypothetical protein
MNHVKRQLGGRIWLVSGREYLLKVTKVARWAGDVTLMMSESETVSEVGRSTANIYRPGATTCN